MTDVSSTCGRLLARADNRFARGTPLTRRSPLAVFSSVSTIEVGNPLPPQATIDLKPRVVDLPSDWSVSVSPASVVLDPAQQATITVTMINFLFLGGPQPI